MKLTAEMLKEKGWAQGPDGVYRKSGYLPFKPDALAAPEPPKRLQQTSKPLLNQTEERYLGMLKSMGYSTIFVQAITLRLDPPFKSYRPDLAYFHQYALVFVEVKGPHRFREKGIAKAALAAKTYPQFRFELAEWTGKEWKESVLTP